MAVENVPLCVLGSHTVGYGNEMNHYHSKYAGKQSQSFCNNSLFHCDIDSLSSKAFYAPSLG